MDEKSSGLRAGRRPETARQRIACGRGEHERSGGHPVTRRMLNRHRSSPLFETWGMPAAVMPAAVMPAAEESLVHCASPVTPPPGSQSWLDVGGRADAPVRPGAEPAEVRIPGRGLGQVVAAGGFLGAQVVVASAPPPVEGVGGRVPSSRCGASSPGRPQARTVTSAPVIGWSPASCAARGALPDALVV